MAKKESGQGRPQGGPRRLQKWTGPSDKEVLTTSQETNKETRSTAEVALTPHAAEPSASKPFPIVGIGASAGGLEAVTAFLKALPANTGMAFVLIQHMDPTHESMLNRLLVKDTSMNVRQIADGMEVQPNEVYVIVPNAEVTLRCGRLRLIARLGGAIRHTPIDTFLCSLAEDQKTKAIGLILSGIGSDGTNGLQAIKAEGGITFAQDEESAKYPGMPLHAEAAGCVDLVLPPEKVARELARMIRHPYLKIAPEAFVPETSTLEDGGMRNIFRLLRASTGVDFANYKQTTVRRRIARRMLVRRCDTLTEYAKYLGEHPDEVRALFEDGLIHVTSFFRDPEVFQYLTTNVYPQILSTLEPGEAIRIWAPGCSSGEEVYSIAMTLTEFLGDAAGQTRIQIFGTDISDKDIQKARAAVYSEATVADLIAGRLRQFFNKVEGGYQIIKGLRELCVFARHDMTRDPPFSRMDMISCRNLLIYLGAPIQRKVLRFFHYALNPNGFLLLGEAESAGAAAGLFSLNDRKANVYSRSPVPAVTEFRAAAEPEFKAAAAPAPLLRPPAFDLRKEAERIVLERYAPPALVVDGNLQVLFFQGDTSPFLKPALGEASFNLLKLVRPDLMLEIRSAIQQAKKSGAARHESVRFKRNGGTNLVDLEVVPIAGRLAKNADFVVLFQNLRPAVPGEKQRGKAEPRSKASAQAEEIEQLKRELSNTQDNLHALVEDQEAGTEELRAANEEILSSNEELHSTNEELETAKEELQSSNEELTTLNEELQIRNSELAQAVADLNNLLNAVEIPVVILGGDQRIRRFTPLAAKLLNLIPTDVGRPIDQIRSNLDLPDLHRMVDEVTQTKRAVEVEVRDQTGFWYNLRMRPYQITDDEVDGILITVIDINDAKQFSSAIVETVGESLLVLDSQLRVLSANQAFYETFRVKKKETENRSLYELGEGQWNLPKLRELLESVLPEKQKVVDFEVEQEFAQIGQKVMLLKARQLYQRGIGAQKVLLAIEDITERKRADAELNFQMLSSRLLASAENEKKHLARELHDAFGQKLAVLNLRLGEIALLIPAQSDVAAEKLRNCQEEFGNLAREIQDFARVLHPAALREMGLAAALRGECKAFAKQTGTVVNFLAENVPKNLSEDIGLCLYRVTQEALQNIWKHSESKKVDVTVKGLDEAIQLTVEDFGKGFDVESANEREGLGLVSMQERARLVGGSLVMRSKPGEGTAVKVLIPLKRG
jgi:two-component system, chemotaxis family, CheB/CheR fusion protein